MCVCVSTVNIYNNDAESQVFKNFEIFLQVDIDEAYTSTKFGGCGFFGLGDIAILQIWPNFTFEPIVHGGQKIELAQKIHANRG